MKRTTSVHWPDGRWRYIGENELSGIRFAEDGLIHLARLQGNPAPGRKDLWTDATYKDAHVCLTCTLPECEGERDCFLRRKKELEEKR